MKHKQVHTVDISATSLSVLFIILKLFNVIKWSWLWVLSPIWLPFVLIGTILFTWLTFMLLFQAFKKY